METKDNKDFIYDLMFFDWVLDENDTPHQLAELGTTFCTDTETNLLMTEKLKPVPLSDAIIEKNGFKESSICRGYEQYCESGYRVVLEKDRMTIYKFKILQLSGEAVLGYAEIFKGWTTSVHEFQQKLRVCGLRDLANSIKVNYL